MFFLFISPHMDDAIGSCGGTIAKLVNMGEQVEVFNLFSGEATPPFSPAAIDLHRQWGSPKDVIRMRRAEDRDACTTLGVKVHFEDIPDSLYRLTQNGKWMYGNDDDIFNKRHPEDDWLVTYFIQRIRIRLAHKNAKIYIPLGIGNHVDHLIAFEIGQLLKSDKYTVWFYEDFPYASSIEAYHQRFEMLSGWHSHMVPLTRQNIQLKVRAFSYYLSQIPMLFQTDEGMKAKFVDFASKCGGGEYEFAERYWTCSGHNNYCYSNQRTGTPTKTSH